MIASFTASGLLDGVKLLILGAVHGNETCGTVALNRLRLALEVGEIKLVRGKLVAVPICNPRAFTDGVRFIERNLNRRLVPTNPPDSYEARLGNILCPMLADCDALLDLHSYPNGTLPFAFVGGNNPAEQAFVASLGTEVVLSGWEEAYAAAGRANDSAHPDEGIGTEEYVRRCGGIATILECGDHADPNAPDVAWRAVIRALQYFKMIDEQAMPACTPPKRVRITNVVYREDAGVMVKQWRNMDTIAAGEVVAHTESGKPITAPASGFVILPHADAPIGQEWFYWGISEV